MTTTTRTRTIGAAGALGAMLAIAGPFIASNEGLRTTPYYDTATVPRLTVCFGETRVEMRKYTKPECVEMLNRALAADFGPKVLACTPTLADRPVVWAAHTDLAYNIGVRNYCGSVASRLTRARQWEAGCEAFMGWQKPRDIIGRRKRARALCLSGV